MAKQYRNLLASSEECIKIGKWALGFHFQDVVFIGEVLLEFIPKGLIIWGAPDGAVLRQCVVGIQKRVIVSCDGIPTKFFSHWKSYAEIARDHAEGIEPVGWASWNSIKPGMTIRIGITLDGRPLGPKDGIDICMWGVAIEF